MTGNRSPSPPVTGSLSQALGAPHQPTWTPTQTTVVSHRHTDPHTIHARHTSQTSTDTCTLTPCTTHSIPHTFPQAPHTPHTAQLSERHCTPVPSKDEISNTHATNMHTPHTHSRQHPHHCRQSPTDTHTPNSRDMLAPTHLQHTMDTRAHTQANTGLERDANKPTWTKRRTLWTKAPQPSAEPCPRPRPRPDGRLPSLPRGFAPPAPHLLSGRTEVWQGDAAVGEAGAGPTVLAEDLLHGEACLEPVGPWALRAWGRHTQVGLQLGLQVLGEGGRSAHWPLKQP